MPPKVDRLVKLRALSKSQIEKILEFAAAATDTASIDALEVRLNQLSLVYNEFKSHDSEIIVSSEEQSELPEVDEIYYEALTKLNELLRLHPSKSHTAHRLNSPNQAHNNASFFENSMFANSFLYNSNVPGISLPKFGGHYDDWQTFIDLFNKTVHENETMSGAQKFTFLKLALKDEAYQLIKHMAVSEANYLEVYDKLNKRYSKKKLILNQFIQQFLELKCPASDNKLRFISDKSDELIRGIKSLGKAAESRDAWLIHIILSKLDEEIQQKWSNETTDIDFPTWNKFQEFLTKCADAIELCHSSAIKSSFSSNNRNKPHTIRSHAVSFGSCLLCKSDHKLYECSEFKKMNFSDRKNLILSNKLCYNCLSDMHNVTNCKSRRSCSKCKKRHHSLLHNSSINLSNNEYLNTNKNLQFNQQSASNTITSAQTNTNSIAKGLLQTAIINIRGVDQQYYPCRALLDSASMASFITSSCLQKLGLNRRNSRFFVEGIGSTKVGVSKGQVELEVSSRVNDSEPFSVEALILSNITSQQPQSILPINIWTEYQHLNLADPTFYQPGPIDVLIGAEHYLSLIRSGHFEGISSSLVAQETVFGWVVSGKAYMSQQTHPITLCSSAKIDETLQRFWEIEQIKQPIPQGPQEIYCEELFKKTTRRHLSGKYIVQLPFDQNAPPLGESKSQAVKRLHAIENRLRHNPNLQQQYLKFMREYLELGHMELISPNENQVSFEQSYYLPHHAITKIDSSTTKLRVVFDASAKSKSGRSLNNNLLVGPTIQQTLQQILLRFRFFKYVMTADVEKMFRQILVERKQSDFQRIVWRNQPTDPIQEYRLMTVTYGTASATFLSARVLRQLSDDSQEEFPRASIVIRRDFYVDDLMTGTDTEDELLDLKQQIIQIMNGACLNLRKWSTNSKIIMATIPVQDREVSPVQINQDYSYVKVLGIFWDAQRDLFSYKVNLNKVPVFTKRGMLSESSRLFDPQGWIAPIIVSIKILFQNLWMHPLNWDDELPENIKRDWQNIRNEASIIQRIEIPRWLQFTKESISLHGFADASKNAYAAVIYARTTTDNIKYNVTIVAAKTKVAPIKQISIAKLELCAAVLLKNLMNSVLEMMEDRLPSIHLWTDSTIVLCWLATVPRNLSTFEGNRVAQIIDSFPKKFWNHVKSSQNPADVASRGILPSQLLDHHIWWTGPPWLKLPESDWPHTKTSVEDLPSPDIIQCNISEVAVLESAIYDMLIEKHSNYNNLIRQLSWVLRFIDNIKIKLNNKRQLNHSDNKPLNNNKTLTYQETLNANNRLIQYVQNKHFKIEIERLKNKLPVNNNSKILSLNPFIDENNILRVGGRICNASVTYNMKYPIIIAQSDPLTTIIVRTMHEQYLHAGPTLLLNIIRQHYWILKCKNVIRQIIHRCIVCFKQKQSTLQPMMADLPPSRVTLVRPFLTTGVDYAGPLYIRSSKRRGSRLEKAYIVVFVCHSTKAIHIELAGDMSTETFIATFRRFVSRRGLCHDIYSDNGSNFIGAKKELHELFKIINNNSILNFFSKEHINWHLNPPSSPHFGGLFEAAVKSIKFHMHRTLANTSLTYEEMYTILTQIEALLNSRPLYVTSDDELNPLTPAHFLIGHPFTTIPDPDLSHLKINHLSRWQYIQKLRQDFWKQWHQSYLTTLQKRTKCKTNNGDTIKLNDIVLIQEKNLPPNKWLLGRIIEVHPGADGIIRVVTIKTCDTILKRPVVKLSILPIY